MRSTITATRRPSSRPKASPEPRPALHLWLLALLVLLALTTGQAWAYSYAAAGKEPLIEGRQALLDALAADDQAKALETLEDLKPELAYLQEDFDRDYYAELESAVKSGDTDTVVAALDSAFVAEIRRRLDGAGEHLDDYQTAKALVFKAKRFLDLVTPQLDADARDAANQAINAGMDALGNPGVFGVGQKPADPDAYREARKHLLEVLAPLQ
ncbi:hypothetical protein [Modicisalibacter coralii]|uniref:hypothetical protein n=1 Tax=Modicisalibacter coralii TaxID=2304602 RepID=UPI0019396463|nr:hypothetical protein [Halomonas coralii]